MSAMLGSLGTLMGCGGLGDLTEDGFMRRRDLRYQWRRGDQGPSE